MSRKNRYETSGNNRGLNVPGHRSGKKEGNVPIVAKVIRATGAVVFFGIPIIVGAGTLLGYGVHKAYKRIIKRP